MKILFIFLFLICSNAAMALELTDENYSDITNKHIYFVPQQKKEMFLSDKKLFNKHKGKEYLVKKSEITPKGILAIYLQDEKKGKEILIKAKKTGRNFKIKGAEILENLATAKALFEGKTLYVNPLIKDANFTRLGDYPIRLYDNKYGSETFASSKKEYLILEVDWSDTGTSPYKLVLSDGKYAMTASPTEPPYGFVFDLTTGTRDQYRIYKKDDKLEKSTFATTKNILKTKPSEKIEFDFYVLKKKNSKDTGLSINYKAESWLFANQATLYIDEEQIPLKIHEEPTRSVLHGGIISESLYAKLDNKLIRKIINGKEVSLRIHGKRGYADGEFIPQNIYNLKCFYEEEIK